MTSYETNSVLKFSKNSSIKTSCLALLKLEEGSNRPPSQGVASSRNSQGGIGFNDNPTKDGLPYCRKRKVP